LQDFKAIDTVSDGNWSYKTVGPLSVPHHADGAICVVLSVDFFSEMRMGSIQTTPVYSFNSQKKGSKKKLEADFAFLWRESAWGEKAEGVAFGEAKTFNEIRQILSGIKQWYKPADLVGKQFVFITNLAPRKMMGLESQGMIMAAEGEDRPAPLMPSEKVPNGSKIR
jgi:hypothetical protein